MCARRVPEAFFIEYTLLKSLGLLTLYAARDEALLRIMNLEQITGQK